MEKQITYDEERRRDELMAEVMESDRLAKLEAEQAVRGGSSRGAGHDHVAAQGCCTAQDTVAF